MSTIDLILITLNSILWHNSVLFALLGTGVLFTVWSGFCQYRTLTHGVHVIRGVYDKPDDPGAINHFQALSAALSATVGLGNIGGVALAISLGGPGAVFWMWVVGFFGMAIKLTEVTLSMLYRNTDDPDNPHGGPMWVVDKAFRARSPKLAGLGRGFGILFCVTLLISTMTGGNMFQAWNVGVITESYFGIPSIATGIVLAIIVGAVIIGGIKRIGGVAGRLVPIMLVLYLVAGIYVLIVNISEIPSMFALIFRAAFSPFESTGAFIGGTMGYAFLFGMKRALFSNEAGQGSSPIAHSAAKTDEPVREGIVAGLEPFIDTIVVCTLTALIILVTGVWNRSAEATLDMPTSIVATADAQWSIETTTTVPKRTHDDWKAGDRIFVIVHGDPNPQSGNDLSKLDGTITTSAAGTLQISWDTIASSVKPELAGPDIFVSYVGATLTARAFDAVVPGLGKWLVTIAVWLFAISTLISWSYYGEQGIIFLAGERAVIPYKLIFCSLTIVATLGFLKTDAQLDNLTGIGTGIMLVVNVPIMWLLGRQAMVAYKDYFARLESGRMGPEHSPPSLEDLISGKDVE
ncbi:MAG: amino acid carrier protein [Gammaproteobacteria bacterium]|jgi:AGCS family alanine or glycine:cation symporter|nr:sodium:alanine symporter family protein [Chromatiales bacterium]MDP6675752.1 amino acid carrier protein [Gammaproteobacteria bacterium]